MVACTLAKQMQLSSRSHFLPQSLMWTYLQSPFFHLLLANKVFVVFVGKEQFSVVEHQLYLRLCLVGLSSAGYSVADTCTSHGVHCLHDNKGPLLQRGHRQVPVIRHRLQVGAVPRPHGVSHLQDPCLVGPHLKEWAVNQQWIISTPDGYCLTLMCYSMENNDSFKSVHINEQQRMPEMCLTQLKIKRRITEETRFFASP